METVRKNNSEFGDSSKVNKVFKLAIQPYLSGSRDGTFHSRLMQLFLNIKNSDLISEKGQRTVHQGIALSSSKKLLKDFVFTPHWPHNLLSHYEFDWTTLTFKVSGFSVSCAQFPMGADYMEVKAGLLRFDFESLAYAQICAAPLIVARDCDEDHFEIICDKIPEGNGILFAIVRISYYRMADGECTLLSGDKNFGVGVVSVWDERDG